MEITNLFFAQAQDALAKWGVLAIILAVVVGFFRSAWFKGKLGEFLVNLAAKLRLDKSKYHLIKDVTLPSGEEAGGTTQIDHIIVSEFGIFVVETKYFRGWIFGSERQKSWTQKIYRKSFKFQNPLHQNYKHVMTLRDLLQLDKHQIHSVVVFIGDSTFKTPMPANVVYGGAYINFIKSFSEPVLTKEQVVAIKQQIAEGALQRSLATDRQHRAYVRETLAKRAASRR